MAISQEMDQGTKSRSYTGSSKAFLIEALVVLALLMACLAIFARLFSSAYIEGRSANQLSGAVLLAQNCAEEFSANPFAVPPVSEQGDYLVRCTVKEQAQDQGTLYQAQIAVIAEGNEVYTLDTSRYAKASEIPALEAAGKASQGGESS